MSLKPLTITVSGAHDTGKTTVASLIRMLLEENGFRHVTVADLPPLAGDQKSPFMDRLLRNRERPIKIRVELEE